MIPKYIIERLQDDILDYKGYITSKMEQCEYASITDEKTLSLMHEIEHLRHQIKAIKKYLKNHKKINSKNP